MKNAHLGHEAICQHLLAASARALAARADLSVRFAAGPAADDPNASCIELPWPAGGAGAEQFALLRGQCDAAALWRRFHDQDTHAAYFGANHPGAALAVALEQLRVNALGSRFLRGVAHNIHTALAQHCRTRNYHLLEFRDQVSLGEALLLRVGSELSVLPLPAPALRVIAAWGTVPDTLLVWAAAGAGRGGG